MSGTGQRIKVLYYAEDMAGQIYLSNTSGDLIYSANRIPEIADDIVNVDNAMKWGFGRKIGPI